MLNGERGIPGRPKVVRGSKAPVLTSHAGLNPRSKSGNESGFAGELSKPKRRKKHSTKKDGKKNKTKSVVSRQSESGPAGDM